jgi:hypothetical protein
MNTFDTAAFVSGCRAHARRLLTRLRSNNPDIAAEAAPRFLRLRSFAGHAAGELLEIRDRVRLKHALAVVALEHGHDSWLALKAWADAAGANADRETGASDEDTFMYERGLDVLLNRWFARYEEARASLEREGGFLLPYRHQFFVCETEGIRELGLDPDDPDWQRIGCDWVRPRDPEAWQRLRDKRRLVRRGR